MFTAFGSWLSASRARIWLAALPLSSGAALIVYIISAVSLALALAVVLAFTVTVSVAVWYRLSEDRQRQVRRRFLVGMAAGLLGTAAYDSSRLLVVTFLPFTFWPFGALPLFGRAVVGEGAPEALAIAIGIVYHLANGIGFGTAFTLIVQRPRVWSGIAWAVILEGIMVSLYPGWLNLKALDEFLSISVIGHLAYGATLGGVAGWALPRLSRGAPQMGRA